MGGVTVSSTPVKGVLVRRSEMAGRERASGREPVL
jgi:hypothetical protein